MEIETLLTGIGGQGIQLAARTLAEAAIADGREVMVFGSYGGMMRGGRTDATVIVGDERLLAPPTVPSAWCALAMHHQYWAAVAERLRRGAVAVVDQSVFGEVPAVPGVTVVAVAASARAAEMGTPMAASMVALGALAAATALTGLDALLEASAGVLPPYRRQHAEANAAALAAGYALVDLPAPSPWAAAGDGPPWPARAEAAT
ncbi:MAG TPA: 2-oxoacid:acceptor oxidoreductase family protein [Acidimicrobiales bacterium]|nr:2-oxoacid:acceptor oxidoreductase family protein [Acidimicrobiales bacterium]